MSPKDIELILCRQLAGYLAMPIIIADPEGRLVFFNEPAEVLLGRRFNETGEMLIREWSVLFTVTDEKGTPLSHRQLPIGIALFSRRPSHSTIWMQGLDNRRRKIEVTAFPLIGQQSRLLGAVAVFWESENDAS